MIDVNVDNFSKPVDENRRQLFHRINSPTFDPQRKPASGLGRDCGCRTPADFLHSGIADLLANFIIKGVEGLINATVVGAIILQFVNQANEIVKKISDKDFLEEAKKKLKQLMAQETEEAIFGKYLRAIPAWVPVERKKYGPDFTNKQNKEVEHEVEGVLTRSFQTLRDQPQFQWTNWYHWAFHVHPINGYRYMYGDGNMLNESEIKGQQRGDGVWQEATLIYQPFASDASMECLMDLGSIWRPSGNFGKAGPDRIPGPMYHHNWPFWPQNGDYFWAAGRWAYDCTHATIDENNEEKELMPTVIHPCKAVAYARYEGFKFDENEKHVPATRFVFFANSLGGYQNCDGKDMPLRLNDKDYEFILDLPPAPDTKGIAWPIGHTPDFPLNTIVLRPRLLMKIEFAPYGIPQLSPLFTEKISFQKIEPIIEPIKSSAERELFDQVKITVPLTKLGANAVACGVAISFGWFDADGTLADKVKKVTVQLESLLPLEREDELRFKIGVNGRWRAASLHDADDGDEVSLAEGDSRIVLHIPDDAEVNLTAHGMERHGFGEFIEEEDDEERSLFVGGILRLPVDLDKLLAAGVKTIKDLDGNDIDVGFLKDLADVLGKDFLSGKRSKVEWKKHVDQPEAALASAVAREMFMLPNAITNRFNEPMGMVDPRTHNLAPNSEEVGLEEDTQLPIKMKHLVKRLKASGDKQFSVKVKPMTRNAEILGNAAYIGVDTKGGSHDYTLQCKVTVEPQP